MSEPEPMPERRQVRVRRSPKVGVFLAIGAVVGALVAVIAGNATPQDPSTPREQAIGYLLILLAPLGAIIGGAVALVLDRIADRRAKTVDAERIVPERPPEAQPAEAQQDVRTQVRAHVQTDEPVVAPAAEPDPTDRA